MALTAKFYTKFFEALANKEVDLDSDALKVMLCTSAYTPAQNTHKYKSSVTNEVTGSGYTAGGAGLTVTAATSGNVFTLDSNDVTWTPSTLTARYAVFYDSTPATDASRPLIAYWDFGQDEISASGNFTLTISASGIATITTS